MPKQLTRESNALQCPWYWAPVCKKYRNCETQPSNAPGGLWFCLSRNGNVSHSRHYPSHRSTLTLALIVPRAAHTSPHTTRSAVSALTTILCNRPSTPHFEPNQLFNITTSTVSRSDVCDLVWVAQEAGTILVLSVKVHVSGRLLLTREFFDADTLVPCTFIAEPRTENFSSSGSEFAAIAEKFG